MGDAVAVGVGRRLVGVAVRVDPTVAIAPIGVAVLVAEGPAFLGVGVGEDAPALPQPATVRRHTQAKIERRRGI